MGIRSGSSKQGWEKSDFPILCETCLGDNPYVRMTKSEFSRECKVCTRPFTVFRWKPGSQSRYKKTEICQMCAKVKNVCQTCIFDLDFNMPVELRDKFIDKKDLVVMPKDAANRDYWANNMAQKVDTIDLPYKKAEVVEQLRMVNERHIGQRKDSAPSQSKKRNQAHVCSFYVQGKCNRGDACPYRHEDITEEDLAAMQKGQGKVEDRIKARFEGKGDPLASKILEKIKEFKVPQPPEDPSITTLFVGGIDDKTSRESLETKFGSFGKIENIRLIPSKKCGFIAFKERLHAEKAFETLYERCYIQQKDTDTEKVKPFMLKLKLLWAKSQLKNEKEAK